ncbi:LysR family transcriptional regulator [Neptunomonas qingdaonensis]|uniref:DNA-binding transcriptional regulator, LysR family n=1 Tax=Neptunomonas qingdaonensis TaxID=1045558 RepID=A0A1I2M7X8_9GAMM|nr:LysR family transcriptional regulator [Neptunomonas qingdaonensis]SFF85627.1 DNA-binding transcriptional regulator, LysR family [Neptunomonas qingdaonensis]
MRLRNLATFIKVARLGSFHGAAQQLHASQPAISARIIALEEELGVKLFSRDKSGTRITAWGNQLLPYAEKLLAISQEMKAQVSQDKPQKGSLRIGIADTLAHLWLSSLLKHWQEEYPLISFELTSDVTPTLIRQLQNHQIDLALMVAEQSIPPNLVIDPLCSYPQCWVAIANHPLANNPVCSIEELAASPILSFPRDSRPWHFLQQYFSSLNEPPVIHTCSSVANLLTLVRQGVGIALLPKPLVEESLKNAELVTLQTQAEPPELAFCYSWRLDDDRVLPRLLADSSRAIMQFPASG